MCGRLSLSVKKNKLRDYLEANFQIKTMPEDINLPLYNIAPQEDLLTIINDGNNYRVGTIKWGYEPAKDFEKKRMMINARVETIEKLNAFKTSFLKRRCLILTDGFFEWKKIGQQKQPYRFTFINQQIFTLAGLWTVKIDESGNKNYTCTIITKRANTQMEDYHERMPVILDPVQAKLWLNPREQNQVKLKELLTNFNHEDFVIYPVSNAVNKASFKDEEVIKPLKKSVN